MANVIAGFKDVLRFGSALLIVGVLCFGLVFSPPAIATPSTEATPSSHDFIGPSSGLLLGSIFGGLFAGNRPDNLGSTDGTLQPCPNSPNCVNSQTNITDTEHAIAPLSFTGSADEAFAALVTVVKAQEGATVITEEADYLYAEFQTSLMGYVDDVEFALSREENLIHVRSASRLGQSDLGLNRQRVETLRAGLGQVIATSNA
ncbi:MAG: DUF1499 domain-containing protein [Cyanophyceae cyanobacterium]